MVRQSDGLVVAADQRLSTRQHESCVAPAARVITFHSVQTGRPGLARLSTRFPSRPSRTRRAGWATDSRGGATLGTRLSNYALSACGTGRPGWTRRTYPRRALSAFIPSYALRTCETSRKGWAGITWSTRALRSCVSPHSLRARWTGRTYGADPPRLLLGVRSHRFGLGCLQGRQSLLHLQGRAGRSLDRLSL